MNKSLKLPTFRDGTVKFYKFTTLVPPQQLADGVTVQGNNGLLDRALLMWRCEEHYTKRMWGEADRDLGKFYIISWLAYGPGYKGRETVGEALEYYEAKKWSLAHSDGPRSGPQNIPDHYFDPAKMDWEQRPVFVGDRMKKLPKGWENTNSKVIAEMDQRPSDKQVEMLNNLSKKNLEDVIKAVKEGRI